MLPEGWRNGQVSDLFKSGGMVTDGDWIESKDQDPNGNIRLVQLADVGDGHFVDKSNRFINNETSERLKCTILREGDVLVARMPDPIGRACLFPTNQPSSITAVDVCIMRPGSSVSAGWLMYLMNSPAIRRDIEAMASGTTRQRVTKSALLDLSIPIPPLPEQRRIAEILGSVDAAIEATKAVIEQTKTVKQGLLQTLLTRGIGHTEFKDSPLGKIPASWEVRRFGDLAKVEGGFAFKSADFSDDRSGVPIVRMSNLKSGVLDLGSAKCVSHDVIAGLERFSLKEGDFLFGMSGSIENYATVKKSDLPCYLNQRVGRLIPKKSYNNFLEYIFTSEDFKGKIKLLSAGAAQLNISPKQVESIEVITPPFPEQQRIGEILASVDNSIEADEQNLKGLMLLKQGLMEDLLTGKVRVTLPEKVAA